jgi:molecular chaperone DnaJ
MNKDPYEVLGVSRDASSDDIQKSYRSKAKLHHPDRNIGNPESEQMFREVQEAYDILSDLEKKSKYDRFGFSAGKWSSESMHNLHDLFGKSTYKGRSIQTKVSLTLEEVASGCVKKVRFHRSKICSRCYGSGSSKSEKCKHCDGLGYQGVHLQPNFSFQTECQACLGSGVSVLEKCAECNGGYESRQEPSEFDVNLPPGISSGHLRIPEQGEPCKRSGGSNGDLMVFVEVQHHEMFKRYDSNLILEIPCSYSQLVNGFDVDVPTVYNHKIVVKIPKETMPNTQIRVKGKGLPGGYDGIGDMFIIPKLDIPKNMPEEYYQVLERLRAIEDGNVTHRRKEWNRKISKY